MLNKNFARFFVSKVCDVERLKEFNTLLSLEQIVIMFFGVNTRPQGSVSKFPSSSRSGKFIIIANEFLSYSILERSSASKQLFNRS